MRSLWTIGSLVTIVLLAAGCDKLAGAGNDSERAAHSVAGAADRMADRLDRPDGAANTIGDVTSPATRIADKAAAVAVPAGSAIVTDKWVGDWRGVEGTHLVIAKRHGHGPGHYTLTMQYTLDAKGVFDGVADGEAIRFSRPDGAHELYAASGDETGLKWLAGKKQCLMVAKGEGYCRG